MDESLEPLDAPAPGAAEGGPDFAITDDQRRAALSYLDGEVARGVMEPVEAEHRKKLATAATTVSGLLAATVVDESPAPTVTVRPTTRTNMLALLIGLVVAVFLLVTIVPRLV
jgi:hypothetical protein